LNAPVDTDCLSDVRAIIVEDSFIVAESLESLLTSHGCKVVGKAANARSGVTLAAEADYDVVILDVRLGHELASDVACAAQVRGKRIIYLTGYSDLSLIPADVSGHPVLAKPVRAEALIETIRGR
jgi:DNA-binding NarL/FixJ family response regulator